MFIRELIQAPLSINFRMQWMSVGICLIYLICLGIKSSSFIEGSRGVGRKKKEGRNDFIDARCPLPKFSLSYLTSLTT